MILVNQQNFTTNLFTELLKYKAESCIELFQIQERQRVYLEPIAGETHSKDCSQPPLARIPLTFDT